MRCQSIQSTGNLLYYGGITFTIIVLSWPVLMVLSDPGGAVEEQLASIADDPFLYRINFFLASLIAPPLVVVMITLALFIKTRKNTPFLNTLGVFFLIPYMLLVTVTYTSQYALLPRLFSEPELAMNWLFGNTDSFVYFINQLGYTFFALSACTIGWKFLFEKGLQRAIGILLWSSGILSVVAFAGLAIQNEMLNAATFISAFLTIPFGVLVSIRGWRLRNVEDIAGLPEPVRKYFRYCGYMGKEKMTNADVIWKGSYIKMAPDKKWMKLKTYQFNSVPEPMRVAYMQARILGIFPFEGRDIYKDGYGNMLGKAVKIFTVVNAKDPEIAQSALITILAEALFIPSYALQDYITWKAVDSLTAQARIQHEGIDVSGLFFFNEKGEFTRFESDDRYYTTPDGAYKKTKFSVLVGNYREKDGIQFPTTVSAHWQLEERDYEYWRGTIGDIKYNIDK